MKAVILKKAGGVNNLEMEEIPVPAIQPSEVLIEVKAISINPVDVKARENEQMLSGLLGHPQPWILGWDVSGTIIKKGSEVTDYKVGDHVFGMLNFPGDGKAYAQYVAASDKHIALMPEGVSFEEAAAATLAALTAWQAVVTNAKIKPGGRVIIHGAAGGVGHYAIQFAKYMGAYVIAVSSGKNRDFVLGLGADEYIDYETVRFEKETDSVDFVLDTIGNDVYDRSLEVIKKGGSIISLPFPISEKQLAITASRGINGYRIVVHSSGEDLKQIAVLLGKGIVKSHVSHSFPFGKLSGAHQQLESGTTGKIVVVLG